MQLRAIELASLPRAVAARALGLRSPQAVSMRLRRMKLREGKAACRRLRRPRTGRLVVAGDVVGLL